MPDHNEMPETAWLASLHKEVFPKEALGRAHDFGTKYSGLYLLIIR